MRWCNERNLHAPFPPLNRLLNQEHYLSLWQSNRLNETFRLGIFGWKCIRFSRKIRFNRITISICSQNFEPEWLQSAWWAMQLRRKLVRRAYRCNNVRALNKMFIFCDLFARNQRETSELPRRPKNVINRWCSSCAPDPNNKKSPYRNWARAVLRIYRMLKTEICSIESLASISKNNFGFRALFPPSRPQRKYYSNHKKFHETVH